MEANASSIRERAFFPQNSIWPRWNRPCKKDFHYIRQPEEKTPAQQWDVALGKIIRLNEDGTIPTDNPFQDKGDLAKTFWTIGHRNVLGIAFNKNGQLWAHEMGPRHGDELNLIVAGENYGWPIVSEGNHYSGLKIPTHDTRTEFIAPKLHWVPTVAPSGLIFYEGGEFFYGMEMHF